VLLGPPGRGPFSPVAIWPHVQGSVHELTAAAQKAITERCGLVLRPEPAEQKGDAGDASFEIAQPVELAGVSYGGVALEIGPRPQQELQRALRQLYWGLAWIEAYLRREDATTLTGSRRRLETVLELSATVPEHERFREAATAFATELATRLECDRVSVGFLKRGRMRLSAMSHSAQFGKKTNLVRSIEAAMEEAIDHGGPVLHPSDGDRPDQITRAQSELSAQSGARAIYSVPLFAGDDVQGALTLERDSDVPFDWRTVELCEAVAAMAGPMLDLRRRDDRLILFKLGDSILELLRRLVGPHRVALKLSVFGALAVLLFLAFARGEYRVSARTLLEPAVKRAAVAPFNGYIEEAPVRAGDIVRQGDLLVSLEDRELQLEHRKWSTKYEQLTKQNRRALADRDAAQVRILTAESEQARTQLDLLDDQLSRTRIVAAFDGIIVSGDLSQSLGAPVEKGQVLFETAPLEAYRVVLRVDERDIADVRAGQEGALLLTAFPDDAVRFTLEKVTPVSQAEEGLNYFRAEAELEGAPARLRPGMEGVGKIEVDRRHLVWIWTHTIVDWLRLKLWRWMP
jgi:hypothetical protein